MISVETVLVVLDSTCVFLDQGLIGLPFFFFSSLSRTGYDGRT